MAKKHTTCIKGVIDLYFIAFDVIHISGTYFSLFFSTQNTIREHIFVWSLAPYENFDLCPKSIQKRLHESCNCSFGNRKITWIKSGEYGGRSKVIVAVLVLNLDTMKSQCGSAF